MKRDRVPLGKLCSLVKGTSPISKTPPGQYPLVTTGEEHKTADSFQFDAEAVCIPLISSTGHGHASLKRVHYQTGKFALANLLAAAIVKDRSVLSTKFLMRYLMFTKDRLIVPLMTGAANMSISIERLATVPIDFPTLVEQERIVKLLDEAAELQGLRAQADHYTGTCIPAVFHEMFGDPAVNPRSWPVKQLGEVAQTTSGGTPNRELPNFFGGGIPWVKSGELHDYEVTSSEETLTQDGLENSSAKLMPPGTILLALYGATVGAVSKLSIEAATNQAVCCITPQPIVNVDYLICTLRLLTPRLLSQRVGGAQPNLSQGIVRTLSLPLPPLPLQQEFAKRVAVIREMEAVQVASRRRLDDLFQSLLYHAFAGEL